MTDKKYTFKVEIDEASARTKARALRSAFERELGNIKIDTKRLTDTSGLKQLEAAIRQQAKAVQQSAQQSAQAQRAADQQTTQGAKAASAERINASRAEATERINASRMAANAAIEAERRLTAQTRAEIQQRQAAQKQNAQAQGGGGGQANPLAGTLNTIKGGAAAYLTLQGLKQVSQMAIGFAEADTSIRRANAAFRILAGSTQEAEARMIALQRASNGTIDRMTGIALANTIAALKLANTSQEFQNLGRSARAIVLVSPIIKDVNDALTQLSLFAANPASFARADQLGLSAGEVKERMAELQAVNTGLDASQAKLLASTQLLDEKYGKLLDSTEAQASGVEKLKVAWSDFYNQQSALGKFMDNRAGDLAGTTNQLAVVSGVGQSSAFLDAARTNLEAIQKQAKSSEGGILSIFGVGDSVQGQAKIFEVTLQTLEKANQAVLDGVPGALEYRTQIEEIVTSQSRWGFATTAQAEQLSSLIGEISRASVSWSGYQKNAEAAAAAAARVAGAGEFAGTVGQINEAINAFSSGTSAGMANVSSWVDELKGLRNELLTTGQLTEDQKYRLDELLASSRGVSAETGILAAAQEQFGSSLIGNNDKVQGILEAITDLNAGLATGRVVQAEYDAAIKVLQQSLQDAAKAASTEFVGAMTSSFSVLQQLNGLATSGVPGLDDLRAKLVELRAEIAGSGSVTPDQMGALTDISAQVQSAAAAQQQYADIVAGMGSTFVETNQQAAALISQIQQVEAAHAQGAISAQQYAVVMQQLRADLAILTTNVELGSTDSIGQLAGAITTLDAVVAGGVPGLDTLLDQAMNLESQIMSTGLVTEEQAASIEYLASAADIAASSTGIYAQIQNALGTEFLANNEHASGLVGQIIQLMAAHENGTISSGVFAGALSILTSQLVSTGEQAGLTAAQIQSAFGALQSFNAQQTASFGNLTGFTRGQNLGSLAASREQQFEANRRRMEQERLAKEQERLQAQAARKAESAFGKAAKETERAFEKAAQELEGSLRNVPGLFKRSSVTQEQLDLSKGGIDQNFADDFLRRLEAEINQNKDIWPDVSLDKAREALERVGIRASDDARLMFQQISEAWESGTLFSNKENLALINAEAVKASVELQQKAKEGQQNIIDHFKNVVGIAVEAATSGGTSGGGGGGGGGSFIDPRAIPDQIALDAPAGFAEQLVAGQITIAGATLAPSAFAAIDAALAAHAFAIRVDGVGGQRLSGPATADGQLPRDTTVEGVLRITTVAIDPAVYTTIDTVLIERIFTLPLDQVSLSTEAQAGFQAAVDQIAAATQFALTPTIKGTKETETGILALLRISAVAIDPTVYSTIDTVLTERIFTVGIDNIGVAPDVLGNFQNLVQTAMSNQVFTITPTVKPTRETESGLIGLLRLTTVSVDPAVFTVIDTILTERIFTLGIDGVTLDAGTLDKFQTDLNASVSLTPTIKPTKETETGIQALLRITTVAIDPAVYTTIDTVLIERIFTLGIDNVTVTPEALAQVEAGLNSTLILTPTVKPTRETETGLQSLLRLTTVAIDPAVYTTIDTILTERIFTLGIDGVTLDAGTLDKFQTDLNASVSLTPTIKPTKETESGLVGLLRLTNVSIDPAVYTTIDTVLTERIFALEVDAVTVAPSALAGLNAALQQAVAASQPNQDEGATAGQAGLNYAMQVEQGFMSYGFPNVGMSFVIALGNQVQAQQGNLGLIGNQTAKWVADGIGSFDFSLALIGMVNAMRASMQKEEVVGALSSVGVDAVHIIRDALDEEANETSWAGILANAIINSITEEFAGELAQ